MLTAELETELDTELETELDTELDTLTVVEAVEALDDTVVAVLLMLEELTVVSTDCRVHAFISWTRGSPFGPVVGVSVIVHDSSIGPAGLQNNVR